MFKRKSLTLTTSIQQVFMKIAYLAINSKCLNTRNRRAEMFCKKDILKFSKVSQEKTCARVSFSMKLQAETPAQLFKDTVMKIEKALINMTAYVFQKYLANLAFQLFITLQ